MPSERVARLALAALLHNLPTLAAEVDQLPPPAARVLRLAQPSDPADQRIVQLAAAYALPGAGPTPLLHDRPLPCIFSHGLAPALPTDAYYPLAPLGASGQPTDWLFPIAEPTPQARNAYLIALFTELGALAQRVDLDRVELAYPHLLAWLQRWARCLPAPGGATSLLDHASLSAAVAACLAHYHADDDLATIEAATGPRLRLLAWQLAPAGDPLPPRDAPDADTALRCLAGRSFLLAAQAELIGHALAEGCGLPLGNLIMARGGVFYLLAPGHSAALAAIERCRQAASDWLHHAYAGEVALALAHVPLGCDQLGANVAEQPGFAGILGALHAALARAQRQPGQGTLRDAGGWDEAAFVLRSERYGEHGACAVCGRLPATGAAAPCRPCAQALAATHQLSQARYIAYYASAPPHGSSAGPCGYALRLQASAAPPDRGLPYLVAKLNDPRIDELAELPGAWRYLADMPLDLGLAEVASQASGRALLGYLGLRLAEPAALLPPIAGPGQASAALAIGRCREIGLFSAGWLRALLGRPAPPIGLISCAQGTQLLVGPWDRMAALALEIRAQLDRFAPHSPALTLAGGSLFTTPRYPPAHAAAQVEEMIMQAGRWPWPGESGAARPGDQLALLGDTIDWAGLPAILEEIDRLHARAHLLPAALLRSLAEYGRLFHRTGAEQLAEGLRYRAQFAFNLARILRSGDDELYRWGDRLIRSLHGHTDPTATRHLSLIATWLLLRRPAG